MIQYKLPCWHYVPFFPLQGYFLSKATCITLQPRHHITAFVKINNCTASLQFVIFSSSVTYICHTPCRMIQFTFLNNWPFLFNKSGLLQPTLLPIYIYWYINIIMKLIKFILPKRTMTNIVTISIEQHA